MVYFDKKFFAKHQNLLLKIANSFWLRWLLGLNRLPSEIKGLKIDKITPDSFHCYFPFKYTKKGKIKNQKVKAFFFTRPRFAEALACNLSPFSYFANNSQTKMVWRFSPIGAIGLFVLVFLAKFIALPVAVIGTTTDYIVDATGVDGTSAAGTGANFSWADVRARAGDYHQDTNDSQIIAYLGGGSASGTWLNIYHGIEVFNTSEIPDLAVISAASVNEYGSYQYVGGGTTAQKRIHSVASAPASNTALADSDFGNRGSTSFGYIEYASYNAAGYNVWTLNASGIANISKTSVSKFGFRIGADLDNSEPTWADPFASGVIAYTTAYTGTNRDPYLSVTYSVGVTSHRFFQMF